MINELMNELYNFENEDPFIVPDSKKIYLINFIKHSGITLLMKLVLLTKKNINLNKYIENYIKENPGEINKRSSVGWTALMFTIRCFYDSTLETTELLLKYHANPNIPDCIGIVCTNNHFGLMTPNLLKILL